MNNDEIVEIRQYIQNLKYIPSGLADKLAKPKFHKACIWNLYPNYSLPSIYDP